MRRLIRSSASATVSAVLHQLPRRWLSEAPPRSTSSEQQTTAQSGTMLSSSDPGDHESNTPAAKYGEGGYALFRGLYADLYEEMLQESTARPPPPREGWTAEYKADVNLAVFTAPPNEAERTGRVTIYCPVVMGNPPKLHYQLYFADFFPMEVLIERNGVVFHASMCAIEGNMHLRNVRAHRSNALGDGHENDLLGATNLSLDSLWARRNLLYDGPALVHLEMDLHGELYDIIMDHGVNLDVLWWAAGWVSYWEHVEATRWMIGLMDAAIPTAARGPEEEFMTAEEKDTIDSRSDEWLEERYK